MDVEQVPARPVNLRPRRQGQDACYDKHAPYVSETINFKRSWFPPKPDVLTKTKTCNPKYAPKVSITLKDVGKFLGGGVP